MEEGIQEMAEKCLRENFQMYLHMRSCERPTKKVKRSGINKARGKGKRISCLSAPHKFRLHFNVPVHASKPGQPETWHCSESGSRCHRSHPPAVRAVKLLLGGK